MEVIPPEGCFQMPEPLHGGCTSTPQLPGMPLREVRETLQRPRQQDWEAGQRAGTPPNDRNRHPRREGAGQERPWRHTGKYAQCPTQAVPGGHRTPPDSPQRHRRSIIAAEEGMTEINDIGDLVRILQEQPQWAETLRGVLLGRELLELPEEFARFVKLTQTNFELVNARLDQVDQRFDRMDQRFDQVDSRLDRLDQRFDRMENDISIIKGYYSEQRMARQVPAIADDLGLEHVRTLPQEELTWMARTLAGTAPLSNELRSFRAADLVAETRDREGNILYVAVEASFTADRRDTSRAARNAELLRQFTGHPALAVVASVRNDQEAQQDLDAGLAHWFQTDE